MEEHDIVQINLKVPRDWKEAFEKKARRSRPALGLHEWLRYVAFSMLSDSERRNLSEIRPPGRPRRNKYGF